MTLPPSPQKPKSTNQHNPNQINWKNSQWLEIGILIHSFSQSELDNHPWSFLCFLMAIELSPCLMAAPDKVEEEHSEFSFSLLFWSSRIYKNGFGPVSPASWW